MEVKYNPEERCPDCYSHFVVPVGDPKPWEVQRFACMGNPFTGELCGKEFNSGEGYKT